MLLVGSVNAQSADQPGTVTLDTASPTKGYAVTATLTDPDGGVTGTTWQWVSAASATGTFTDISGATSATYTPVDGDVSSYLRATASYEDALGPGKSANLSLIHI